MRTVMMRNNQRPWAGLSHTTGCVEACARNPRPSPPFPPSQSNRTCCSRICAKFSASIEAESHRSMHLTPPASLVYLNENPTRPSSSPSEHANSMRRSDEYREPGSQRIKSFIRVLTHLIRRRAPSMPQKEGKRMLWGQQCRNCSRRCTTIRKVKVYKRGG